MPVWTLSALTAGGLALLCAVLALSGAPRPEIVFLASLTLTGVWAVTTVGAWAKNGRWAIWPTLLSPIALAPVVLLALFVVDCGFRNICP